MEKRVRAQEVERGCSTAVVNVSKKGDKADPRNYSMYRGITLLSTAAGETLRMMLNDRMGTLMEKEDN